MLLLCKVYSEGKLIGDILLPAFLTKNPEVQTILCQTLPAIACKSLGSFSVVLNTTKENFGHVVYANETVVVSIVCSKCHNTDRTKLTPEKSLEKINKEQIVLHTESNENAQSNDVTVVGQRNLFAKFLNCKMYSDISDSGFLSLIEVFSNHSIFNFAVTAEVFSEANCQDVLKALRPFMDNISVSIQFIQPAN